ncbi:MAG: hypothetical protein U0263_38705 [Polyangiaceae bacterium]
MSAAFAFTFWVDYQYSRCASKPEPAVFATTTLPISTLFWNSV